MQTLLDKISTATLVVQFVAGVEQAAREASTQADDAEDYAAVITLLREAKATLPPDLQHLVRRVFKERLRYEDIAAELDVDRKTVARRLNRALDRLREYLVAHGVTHAPAPADIDMGAEGAEPLDGVPESSRKG
jgi:RNA polymerase sigma factor (sigma-70 family)